MVRIVVFLTASALAALLLFFASDSPAKPDSDGPEIGSEFAPGERVATYYPTPYVVAERMFEIGRLRDNEVHFDLGSGDGRLVIMAAQRGARSVGFEIDWALIRASRQKIRALGLGNRAAVAAHDLLAADLSPADLITVFLTPEALAKVSPRIAEQAKTGARVVAYKFPLPGLEPSRVVAFEDTDPSIPRHEIFLYEL